MPPDADISDHIVLGNFGRLALVCVEADFWNRPSFTFLEVPCPEQPYLRAWKTEPLGLDEGHRDRLAAERLAGGEADIVPQQLREQTKIRLAEVVREVRTYIRTTLSSLNTRRLSVTFSKHRRTPQDNSTNLARNSHDNY